MVEEVREAGGGSVTPLQEDRILRPLLEQEKHFFELTKSLMQGSPGNHHQMSFSSS